TQHHPEPSDPQRNATLYSGRPEQAWRAPVPYPGRRGASESPARGLDRLPPRSRHQDLSPDPPSGKNIGRLVVAELVIELRQQPAGVVVEATVAGAGDVAGEGEIGRAHV